MKNNKRHTGIQKDKLFMIAASVFILTAFTMTGVYVADSNKQEQDGYLIDFSELEGQAESENKATDNTAKAKAEAKPDKKQTTTVQSGKVENPKKAVRRQERKEEIKQDAVLGTEKSASGTEAVSTAEEKETKTSRTYTFSDTDSLAWPVVGNVLLNFSMDKAIYYQTMQQYRYNPSVVIAAKEDEPITAAADARVISVFQDAEIGKGVIFDLGSGYELTYGQLKGITVKEGEEIQAGDLIGYVDKPTIYYSEEGSNLYVKLTKDGTPIDPLQNMQEQEAE